MSAPEAYKQWVKEFSAAAGARGGVGGRWGQDLSLVLTGGSESVVDTQEQLEREQGGG